MQVYTVGLWTDFLGCEDFHIWLDRNINVNRQFREHSRAYMYGSRFSGMLHDSAMIEDNLNIRALLRESYGSPTLRVIEYICSEALLADISSEIQLANGNTGLVMHVQGYGFHDVPLGYQVVYVPLNARRLEVQPKLPIQTQCS